MATVSHNGSLHETVAYTLVVADEDQMGEDFVCHRRAHLIALLMPLQLGFLTNLVSVFPSLKTRPLLLTGESYAGIYIVCWIFHVLRL